MLISTSDRRNFIRRTSFAALLFTCIFLFTGLPWLRYPGIQNDEALFAAPIFHPVWASYWVEMPHLRFPGFLLSYLGAFKSCVYELIFHLTPPTPEAIRFPALAVAAVSIWLFFLLLCRIAGTRAGIFGTALLATDSLYLLTARYDWGPVAFQHLFLVAGLLLAVRYHQEGSLAALAGAFFAFGLGLWDKALFVWLLGGAGVALAAVYPRQLWRSLRLRTAGVALLAFALGAFPVIVYNLDGRGQPLGSTFRGNAALEPGMILPKLPFLADSLKGGPLFGYLTRLDPEGHFRNPETPLEKSVAWVSRATGHPRSGLLLAAFLAAVVAIPVLAWLRDPAWRPALFALVAMAVAWVQMAATHNAGASAHHTVLLWPLPHMVIALVFAAFAARFGKIVRGALTAAVAVVGLSGLLVTNTYYADLIGFGGSTTWTDAIYPLEDRLVERPGGDLLVLDWGIFDSLRVLSGGRLNLRVASDTFASLPLDAEKQRVARDLVRPGNRFLAHTEAASFAPEVLRNLDAWARAEGYRKEGLEVIADRNGRPVFQIFRLSAPPARN